MAYDVGIVGAGVIGLAIAEELLRAGLSVVLWERNPQPGREASWAAAGFLRHRISTNDPYGWLSRQSAQLYPSWTERLREETGIDPEYRQDGGWELALTEEKERSLRRMAALHAGRGIRVRWVEGETLRQEEPALSKAVRGGNLYEDDAQVRPPRLLRALSEAVRRRGGALRTGVTVERLEWDGNRCVGVQVEGRTESVGTVILAAGAWSGVLAHRSGLFLPVRPVRGQVIQLDPGPVRLRRTVSGEGFYLAQRQDGVLLVGSTVEEVGFLNETTPEGVTTLQAGAARLIPSLEGQPVLRAWAGLRPAPAHRVPYLGPIASGLWVATAHFRIGILLAPATAQVVAQALSGGSLPISLDLFSPERDRRRVERNPDLLPLTDPSDQHST